MSSANIVDLVGSPSPSPLKPPMSARKFRRLARSRGNGASGGGNDGDAKVSPEIIDLEADLPPESPAAPFVRTRSRRRPGQKRSRPPTSWGLDTDDDDVVEVVHPPRAAVAGTSLKRSPAAGGTNNLAGRIREVFPLVSRAKVGAYLAMARSYAAEDDVLGAVTTVLSEDPLGVSVSEASFAALVVGGRVGGRKSLMGSPGGGKKRGRRKVARLECQCCFVEYDFEEMVSCRTGGHLFCKVCLQRHTEQRVFGVGNLGVKHDSIGGTNKGNNASKALEILCMASDCASSFHESQLRKACSEKVMAKYNELQYAAVIESANVEGAGKCPKCNFIAIVDDKWPSLLFHCPECNFRSCRKCGEEYHPKLRCDQVETKDEADGRRKVEEAMTAARVRTCPRPMCRKKFLKSDGCNKMTCSCGCFVCYVCRKEIPADVAYKHFCQTPHCDHKSCNKCPLYADMDEADGVRVREAAMAAARSVKDKVKVDVNAMLKDPPPIAQFGRKG